MRLGGLRRGRDPALHVHAPRKGHVSSENIAVCKAGTGLTRTLVWTFELGLLVSRL